MRFTQIFEQLDLTRNEAIIYEALIQEEEASVAHISKRTGIHRRNIHDALRRMIEKGLVFEIIRQRENHFKAVNPDKLMEFIKEKEEMLSGVLPELQSMYREKSTKEQVYIYRGAEGWKNYMRDMLRVGEDFWCLNAKGGWLDARVQHFFPTFIKETKKRGIKFHHLFENGIRERCPEVLEYVSKNFKILPAGYPALASVDVFGDHVNVLSHLDFGGFTKDDFTVTVIINPVVADAFRTWFRMLWDMLPEEEGVEYYEGGRNS